MPGKNILKLDTNETAFFKKQTEHIKRKSYDVKHKLLKAATLIPVSTEAGSGAQFITFTTFDMIGQSKIISNYVTDFARVDVTGKETQAKVKSTGNSYGYSIDEIRASQEAGANLSTRKATASRKSSDQLMNKLAWLGDSDHKLQGLINYPGTTKFTVPVGASTFKTWSSKTPDEIVADVTGMVNAVMVPTNGVEQPDTLLLPLKQYNDIASRRMTDGNDATVLSYILDKSPYINTVEWVDELVGVGEDFGSGVTDRMMVYEKDEDILTFEIPQPYEVFGPQQKAMEFEFFAHAKTGGVIIYYVAAVAFGDGI